MATLLDDNIKTQSDILQEYYNYLKAQNIGFDPEVDPVTIIFGNMYAGLFSGIYATLYLYSQNLFIQTASGKFIDRELASYGLRPRNGGQYALGNAHVATTPTVSFLIPEGTILTDSSGLRYIVDNDTTVYDNTTIIPVRSFDIGTGYSHLSGDILTFQTPISGVTSIIVNFISDGSYDETDDEAKSRALSSVQSPRLGGTENDYKQWCLEADNNVTGSIISSGNTAANQVNIYLYGSQFDIDSILSNPDITYSRSVNSTVVSNVNNYLEGKRPFTDSLVINSVNTNILSSTIGIAVTLSNGHHITDIITIGTFNNTIQNLIQRETRRAIILASLNAQLIGTSWYIAKGVIEDQLLNSLSANPNAPGVYLPIILNLNITLTDPKGLVVDNPKTSVNQFYDITYSNITVTEI